jgi:ferredoxin--NADP+ reductase
MTSPDKYTTETITEIRSWTPKLFSFRTTRYRGYRFIPGQFARLGVRKQTAEGEKIVWRRTRSFRRLRRIPRVLLDRRSGGEFTSTLADLKVGDEILIDKTNYGALTTDRFVEGRDLWLLSTGTGLAPFISILHDVNTWKDYENIILVHGVRFKDELAYSELIEAFRNHEYFGEFADKLKYVQVVTRDEVPGALRGRIPQLLEDGELERSTGVRIDPDRARIMICGNPEMVDDLRKHFIERGYTLSRTRQARPSRRREPLVVKNALILFAHGSRDPEWVHPFEALRRVDPSSARRRSPWRSPISKPLTLI